MDLFSFGIAILPVFLIGLYIYNKDRQKESSQLLIKLFLLGVASCFPAAIIGSVIGGFLPDVENMNVFQLLCYSFIVVALVEEFCKWFSVYKLSYNHEEFSSMYDMIVYASFVALGFACFENILYVSSGGIITGIVRAISAVPGHVCDGILMGFYLGLSKLSFIKGDVKSSKKYKNLSIIIPTITHGIYDFCVFYGGYFFMLIFIIYVIVLYVICVKKVKNVSTYNFRFKYKYNFCTVCGTPVGSRFCPGCGRNNE